MEEIQQECDQNRFEDEAELRLFKKTMKEERSGFAGTDN